MTTRRDMLKMLSAMAASVPALSLLQGCAGGEAAAIPVNFEGRVLVIGAGAAGLAAGYMLSAYGVDVQILEASPVFGGRVRKNDDLAEFPIDMGAEWIHEDPVVLSELVQHTDDVTGSIDVITYNPQTISSYSGGRMRSLNFGSAFYSEHKFKRTTWYDFLETYIVPEIADRIRYERPVVSIDYSGDTVVVTDASGATYEAERVIVTVPVKILQQGSIDFSPALPADKTRAIDKVFVPDGLKAFFRFSERFYPDLLVTGSPLQSDSYDRLFYDGAFRKDSPDNVLAFFCVGPVATQYTELGSDEAIAERLLEELDEMFDGQASANLIDVVVQNWSAEPHIQGAYSYSHDGNADDIIAALRAPVDGRVFFAGEATSHDNTATVPGAMQSAYEMVERILRDNG